jgi:serine/alanine adding enzyme
VNNTFMKVTRTLDEREWRRFVDEHPDGRIFHTPEMFEVWQRTKGHRPELWATVNGEGRTLALLLPVQHTVVNGLLRRLTTRSVVYGSVLCAPGAEGREALALLLQSYTQEVDSAILFTELRNLVDLGDLQPVLGEFGFEYQDHLNFLIDLDRPTDEIMADVSNRTRKRIRSGMRKGDVEIVELHDEAGVRECYGLLEKTYGLAQVPLSDYSLFKAAFDVLHPKGMARFFLARVEGQPAATSIDLMYRDVAFGWYGGTDREYSSYVPNELLSWHVINWSAEHGYKVYDWGGAGKPDEEYGPRDFKAKFGGQLVSFGRNVCVHAPMRLRASEIGYNTLRQLGVLT